MRGRGGTCIRAAAVSRRGAARREREHGGRGGRAAVLAIAIVLAWLAAGDAAAHRLAPSYLELVEGGGGAAVLWKTPRLVARGARVEALLPCPDATTPEIEMQPAAWIARWRIDCGGESLVGAEVAARGLAESGSDVLLRIVFADGRELRAILSADAPRFRIPARERPLAVAAAYLRLGAWHLLTGPDHVLFVLGLLALLGAGRGLLLAISSFTLGHSLTLAAAVLGFARIPAAPVEVAIAASLVLLAGELAARPLCAPTPLRRRPGWLPLAFGLLHGLGFAGALGELGLPRHAIPLALLSFNLGIELAQLALLAAALPLLWLWRLRSDWPRQLTELPATALGALGCYWIFARSADWLSQINWGN